MSNRFFAGRDLADRMGVTPATLTAHVTRGTVTAESGYVENRGGRRDYLWAPDTHPTLTLLGGTALVPASPLMAAVEAENGFYAAPCRRNGFVGRYSGFDIMGLCRAHQATFYTVTRITRIGYLDPVRADSLPAKEAYWQIPADEAEDIIRAAALDEEDRSILRAVCASRAELDDFLSEGLSVDEESEYMVDPREIAVYTLDTAHPIASGVQTREIIRGAMWTLDEITPDMDEVGICTLDDIAVNARSLRG